MSDTNNPVQLFSELLGSPLGDLISSVGQGVGDAQAALDQGALQQTLEIYDVSKDDTKSTDELNLLNLIRGMGYQPTFYTIPETEVEAQISLSLDLKSETNSPVGGYTLSKFKVNATPLNAGNTNRFGLQANAMAKLKFKIVPVPPPPGSANLRLIPDFNGKYWNENTKAMIQSLGFNYELRTENDELITDEAIAEGVLITSQFPLASAIANTSDTVLVLKFSEISVIPDLSAKVWNEETKEIILNLGIMCELRKPDETLVEDSELTEDMPITGQTPKAGTFVNTKSALLVLTVTI